MKKRRKKPQFAGISILPKKLAREMSALAESARNPRNESHTATLNLRQNWSSPNLAAQRWLRDAAADAANMSRYASTCRGSLYIMVQFQL